MSRNGIEEGIDMSYLPQDSERTFMYSELSGPKHCPPSDSRPKAYFKLFLVWLRWN
ncbi:hypothetical protein J6590_034591 [Homalodisca vitripennis]|nr:hypothetical protein J6590_034591 [Homalodisca vitripennis]